MYSDDIVVDNLNQIGWVDTTTFKLQQSSPAVDSASPNSLFSFDYYGNPVPCDGVPGRKSFSKLVTKIQIWALWRTVVMPIRHLLLCIY